MKPKAQKKVKVPRTTTRFSMAEWYGQDILTISDQQRQHFGQIASQQMETGDLLDAPLCPFLSQLKGNTKCNKKGGVCSIRRFQKAADGSAIALSREDVVITCPSRFLQNMQNGESIFTWIAEKMLETTKPIVVSETPFLRRVSDAKRPVAAMKDEEVIREIEEEVEEEKKAGRIDWILVHPESMHSAELNWCAVETQALYFSGKRRKLEFDRYAAAPGLILFPVENRRPDYRSSGPKRLSPQLDVKVPVLRSWGKKVVVVIDRFFFTNMNSLEEALPRARDDRARRDSAEVVWFIVDFDDNLRLSKGEVHFTTLSSSRRALDATEPLEKSVFTHQLEAVIDNPKRTNKVFKI